MSEIKNATGKELSRLAGGVLQPDFCNSCIMEPDYCGKGVGVCSAIPLTPDNAFKWRKWVTDKRGHIAYTDALLRLGFYTCFQIAMLTEEEIIRAVCWCELTEREIK